MMFINQFPETAIVNITGTVIIVAWPGDNVWRQITPESITAQHIPVASGFSLHSIYFWLSCVMRGITSPISMSDPKRLTDPPFSDHWLGEVVAVMCACPHCIFHNRSLPYVDASCSPKNSQLFRFYRSSCIFFVTQSAPDICVCFGHYNFIFVSFFVLTHARPHWWTTGGQQKWKVI